MNYAFSVDDFDALWHSPMEAPTPDVPFHAAGGGDREKMNRSSSEWEFQRFIQEASASPAASASSVVAGSPAAIERGDEDALEINNPPLPSRPPSAPVDSDEYQNYLKSRLQLACAAVAMSRGPTGKPQSSTPVDAKELDTNPTKLGSEAFGPGNGFSMEQHKADGKPLDVPALPALQKKSGGGTTTSESSREHSDDDDLEGDTGTTGNRYPADDRRARRMLSNRESARRSRRRKQEHVTDLEKKVAQLNVEKSSLSDRLTDVNQKYKDASVDNRVLRADIETLRAKVKMAEESVKRATGFNPLLQTVPDISRIGAPFVNRSSNLTSGPLFHQPIPSITGISRNQRSDSVLPGNLDRPMVLPKIGQAYPPQSVAGEEPIKKQNPVGPMLSAAIPGDNGRTSLAALDGKK